MHLNRSKPSDDAEPTQREFLFDGAEGIDATQAVGLNFDFLTALSSDSKIAGYFR